MGRRKKAARLRAISEPAPAPIPTPRGRTRAFRLLCCAALALMAMAFLPYWWSRHSSAADLALVRERAFFAFGAHLTADDFADLRPPIDRFMADAKARGVQVTYFLEFGGMEPPVDPATGRSYHPAVWSNRLTRDPAFAARWRMKCKQEMDAYSRTLLRMDPNDASIAHPDMAGFFAAQHAFLVAHREDIADVQFEDLSVDGLLAAARLQAIEKDYFLAYVRGRFDEYRKLLIEYEREQAGWIAARDTDFVAQVARCLQAHPDRLVLTIRGAMHWPNARRLDLGGELSPRISKPESEFGIARLGLMRVTGATLGQAEEMRVALTQAPGHLLQQYWMRGSKRWSRRQATEGATRVFNQPSFTAARAEALSGYLSRFDWEDPLDQRYAEVVHGWLKEQGLLPP